MPAAAGQLLPCADRWQVLTRCQQYRPGAPAEGSTSPPAQSQLDGVSIPLTPSGWKVWHRVSSQDAGGRRGTIGGSRRISFRAFAR